MTLPQPADPAMTDEEIERLFAWLYKAKTAIYLATEASVADDISSNLVRVTKVLTAEIAARKEAEEREAYWQGVAERALAKQHDMQREIDAAREDARIRLAQRPFDEAYARIEPIVALYLRTAGTDSECLTETACNRILEAAFRHTFDADWLALEARAVAAEARIAELSQKLSDAISWIEDLSRKNASHQMLDHCLADLRTALGGTDEQA